MNGSAKNWICTADIDFFSGGNSISFKDVSIKMTFTGRKWIIMSIEPNVF
jgi:hypothetical protein